MFKFIEKSKIDISNLNLRLILFMVFIAGLLYGYDLGVMSGTLFYISNSIPMSEKELEIVVGAVFLGALFGSLIAGPLADYIGRRLSMSLASLCFIVGVLILLVAQSFLSILIARIFLGLGIGFISVIIPLYTVEFAPAKDRGKFLTIFQIFLTFGILLAYFFNYFLAFSESWRGMFGVLLVPSFLLLIVSYFLPETPRWLIAKNKISKAKNILMSFKKEEEIEKEVENIQLSNRSHDGHWKDFLLKNNFKILILVCVVALCNQLIGASSILQYAPLLMKAFGFSSNSTSMLGTVGVGILNLFFTIIAFIFVDSFGRKPLLLIGVMGVFIADFMIGFVNLLNLDPNIKLVLSTVGLFAFISFFAVGPGAIVWLVISEHFPNKLRGKGIALCLFFNSLASTIVSSSFLFMLNTIGISGMFFIFSLFALVYYWTVKKFLFESKNKELEEMICINNQAVTT